jgi:hypothetical protein
MTIGVSAGSLSFIVEGNQLLTFDGRTIVRYFGRDRVVVVGASVEILGKSCFEDCRHRQQIVFENGSRFRWIGPSALSSCKFLTRIPASVEIIDDEALQGCSELEDCWLDEDASLVRIRESAIE